MVDVEGEGESGFIYLTAVEPFGLDYSTRYPLLAIRAKYSEAAQSRIGTRTGGAWFFSLPLDGMQICAKDTYLLTADLDGRFRWISPRHSRLHKSQLADTHRSEGRKRQTRYSIEEENWEESDVIYPIRQFSITSVNLDGFDPSKACPVLAIDTDKYLPEEESGEVQPEGPQTETMAFFLVGDDNGEFVWVSEDECKLYPLTE